MDSKNLIEPKIEPKEEVARASAPQLGSKMEKQTPGMRQSLLAAKELAAQLEKTFSEGEEEHERNDGWQGVNRQGKAPRERRYFPLGGKCDVAKVLWEFAKSRSSRRAGEKHSGPTQGAG